MGVHLIERMNQSATKEARPQAIGQVPRKVPFVAFRERQFDQLRAGTKLGAWRIVGLFILFGFLDLLLEFLELVTFRFDRGRSIF